MNYREVLTQYVNNMKQLDALEDLTKNTEDRTLWRSNMKKRADALAQLFESNNQLIEKAKELEQEPILSLEDEDRFFECAFDFYSEFYDTQILAPMFLKLIHYYESLENPEIDRMLACYYIYSACINEVDVRNTRDKLFVKYYKKIVEYATAFQERNRLGQNVIICAYHSLICAALDSKAILPKDTIQYLREFKNLVSTKEIQDILIEKGLYDRTRVYLEKCLGIYGIIYELDKEDVDFLREFYEYDKTIDRLSPQALMEAKLYLDTYDGKLSYYEASKLLLESFTASVAEYEKMKSVYQESKVLEAKENAIWLEFMNAPFVFENFVSRIEDKAQAILLFSQMDVLVNGLWTDIKTNDFIHVYPQLISMWIDCEMKYMDDREELKVIILNGILRKQISTYIHSVMVKNIALAIYEENKEYFRNVPVDNIKEYIQDAALFHDIGKISIASIINTQDRRLSDVEFSGIRKHPNLGIEIIQNTHLLDDYKDVILYHHKFYDGTGGYPQGNENTKSKYRKVIDLITISDCIDAATDYFGRNYKKAKSVYEVVGELKASMGVRYNPDIVTFLLTSESLKNKIISITQNERENLMYQALKEGIENL